ncbi:MAG: hypothetical protein ACRD3M_04805 [Thermoanaerobaculia bacterium]
MRTRFLLVFLIGIALAAAATAQTKISGTIQCGKPDPTHAIDVGDRPGHGLAINKAQCNWTKPLEMAGSQSKDGVSVSSDESSGDKSTGAGFHWGTMASGDKYFVRFQGTSVLKEGAPQSVDGTWRYTGGTGKLKGIKGSGTYKCSAPNPDGSMTYEVVGDYHLPQ